MTKNPMVRKLHQISQSQAQQVRQVDALELQSMAIPGTDWLEVPIPCIF